MTRLTSVGILIGTLAMLASSAVVASAGSVSVKVNTPSVVTAGHTRVIQMNPSSWGPSVSNAQGPTYNQAPQPPGLSGAATGVRRTSKGSGH